MTDRNHDRPLWRTLREMLGSEEFAALGRRVQLCESFWPFGMQVVREDEARRREEDLQRRFVMNHGQELYDKCVEIAAKNILTLDYILNTVDRLIYAEVNAGASTGAADDSSRQQGPAAAVHGGMVEGGLEPPGGPG